MGIRCKSIHRTDHYESSSERYGDWSESHTNRCGTIVNKVTSGPDIVSRLDIPQGSNALVVWVQWSTGDSFGTSEVGEAEVFGIFLDLLSAIKLRDALRTAKGELNLTTPDGQTFKYDYLPWQGYFESLDFVEISVVAVH